MDCYLSSSVLVVSGEGVDVARVASEGVEGYVSVVVEGVRLVATSDARLDIRVAFGETG